MCDPVDQFIKMSQEYANNFASELQEPMLNIFLSLVGLWVILVAFQILAYGKNPKDFRRNLVHIIIADILLTSQGTPLLTSVFNTTFELMGNVSEVAFKVAGGDKAYLGQGLVGLVMATENSVRDVINIATNILTSSTWRVVVNVLYAILLVAPYILLLGAYVSQVIVSIFRLVMLTIFGHLFFLAFAFGWGEGMAKKGLQTLFSSILVLFSSTAAVAMAIFAVNTAIPDAASTTSLADYANLSNPQFIVAILIGWAGTAFLMEGTSIANSIAGSSLTNTAAGIMTAGISATGAGMLAASRLPAAGKFGLEMAKAGAVRGGLKLVDAGVNAFNPNQQNWGSATAKKLYDFKNLGNIVR